MSTALIEKSQIATGLAVVKFWAPWCGPCKAYAKTFDDSIAELQAQFPDLQAFAANVDEDLGREVSGDAGVRAIPATVVYRDGKLVGTVIGNTPQSLLVPKLKDVIIQSAL